MFDKPASLDILTLKGFNQIIQRKDFKFIQCTYIKRFAKILEDPVISFPRRDVPGDVHWTAAVPRSIITRVTRYTVAAVYCTANKANQPTYPAPPCTARCSWL